MGDENVTHLQADTRAVLEALENQNNGR